MIAQRLTTDLISDPTLWRMYLCLCENSLEVLLTGPESAERPVISAEIRLADRSLAALENAVYDNPLLLSDFSRSILLLSTPEFALVPNELLPQATEVCNALLPDQSAPRQLVKAPMPSGVLCALADSDTLNFLHRTFPDAAVDHSLACAARWLHYFNRQRGFSAHVYALCKETELEVVMFTDHGDMELANRFDIHCADDAAYYIHLCAPQTDTPITVGGSPALRNAVCETLRRARPEGRILPLTLPEHLLQLRASSPELCLNLLFLTEL